MKSTGERHAPERVRTVQDTVLDVVHRYPYKVAHEMIAPGDRVLEVGFGDGYGAAILGEHAREYVGLEIEREAVEHAAQRYGAAGRSFRLYDGRRFPLADDAFDFVFSSQVIEHVEDVESYLREIARTLRPGGRGLIVTPNRVYRLAPGERPWNRFHLVEYDAAQLSALLSPHFAKVDIHGMRSLPDVEDVEIRRVARLRKLARVDRLGLRYRLPPLVVKKVSDALQWLRPTGSTAEIAPEDVRLEDVYHTPAEVDRSLNLMALIEA